MAGTKTILNSKNDPYRFKVNNLMPGMHPTNNLAPISVGPPVQFTNAQIRNQHLPPAIAT